MERRGGKKFQREKRRVKFFQQQIAAPLCSVQRESSSSVRKLRTHEMTRKYLLNWPESNLKEKTQTRLCTWTYSVETRLYPERACWWLWQQQRRVFSSFKNIQTWETAKNTEKKNSNSSRASTSSSSVGRRQQFLFYDCESFARIYEIPIYFTHNVSRFWLKIDDENYIRDFLVVASDWKNSLCVVWPPTATTITSFSSNFFFYSQLHDICVCRALSHFKFQDRKFAAAACIKFQYQIQMRVRELFS